jgi:hypothetical protein
MAYFEQGKYTARIGMAQVAEAKNEKKTPQLELHLELVTYTDREGKEWEPPQTRFPPVVYLSLTEQTLGTEHQPGWVRETLNALGFDGDFDRVAQLEGKEVSVWNQHEKAAFGKNAGQMVDRWSIDRGSAGRSAKPAEKSTVKTLNTLWGKKKARAKPANGEPSQAVPATTEERSLPPQNVPVAAAAGADIPF